VNAKAKTVQHLVIDTLNPAVGLREILDNLAARSYF
jgi:hypothetical protein